MKKKKSTPPSLLLSSNLGLTLLEIMIVVAIIALIAGLVSVNVMKKFDEAKVNATKIQMKQMGVILDDYRRVCGTYPSTEQGLDALVKAPTFGKTCKNYDPEGFVKRIPQDAWSNDFLYTSDGSSYELKSLGRDGKEGGEGFDKDISSKELD